MVNIGLWWYVVQFKSGINVDLLKILFQTHQTESTEFLFSYVSIWIVLILALTIFIYLIQKLPKELPQYLSRNISIGSMVTAILLFFLMSPKDSSRYYAIKNRVFPFSGIELLRDYKKDQIKQQQFKDLTKNFSFNAQRISSTGGKEVHLLILGESSRPDHWEFNGYHRPTAPFLSKEKNLISFPNAVSQAGYTLRSLPMILTRGTPSDFERCNKEKSIISAYKEAGFTTYWLSSLPGYVFFDDVHYDDYRFHEADYIQFSDRLSGNDSELLDFLKETLSNLEENEKALIVLHGYGNHHPYDERYPSDFNRFKGDNKKEQIIAEYDNSVLYNDHILHEITTQLNQPDLSSYFLFISDHGDNLFDDSRGLLGHSIQPSEYTLRVSFLFWCNDQFKQDNLNKFELLEQHKNLPISSNNLFHTMLDLSRIKVEGEQLSSSISNSDFSGDLQEVFINENLQITFQEFLQSEKEFKP